MKTPFTLEAWLKDTSQKVVDKNGRPVRIVCTDADGLYPIIGLVDNKIPLPCGKDGRPPYIGGGGGTLFLVTPEPELSEFEKACMKLYNEGRDDGFSGDKLSNESVKESASELLALAREELFANDAVLKEYAEVARKQGKAKALRTRATELTDNLVKSGLDKDSIPYHLIEFMCNLYTCQNWKEIEETTEAYDTRIKAAALKDLPRWKKVKGARGLNYSQETKFSINGRYLEMNDTLNDIYEISFEELEKLPGFNE